MLRRVEVGVVSLQTVPHPGQPGVAGGCVLVGLTLCRWSADLIVCNSEPELDWEGLIAGKQKRRTSNAGFMLQKCRSRPISLPKLALASQLEAVLDRVAFVAEPKWQFEKSSRTRPLRGLKDVVSDSRGGAICATPRRWQ